MYRYRHTIQRLLNEKIFLIISISVYHNIVILRKNKKIKIVFFIKELHKYSNSFSNYYFQIFGINGTHLEIHIQTNKNFHLPYLNN
jgi:hypothetical protein